MTALTTKNTEAAFRWLNQQRKADFVAAPLVMLLMLYPAPFEPTLKAGLLIYSLYA